MRECMAFPGWSPRETARRARRNLDVVRNMARNRHPIDPAMADWLESIAAQWTMLPPPARDLARSLGCANGIFTPKMIPVNDWVPMLEKLSYFHLNHGFPPLI